MFRLLHTISVSVIFATTAFAANQTCKITPLDTTWPSVDEWSTLNRTIDGGLIKTSPVASSCYSNNPFDSPDSCEAVEGNWTLLTFHASLPESIDYPLFANNSCLPPGSSGYTAKKGCSVGAYPQYVVNATTEEQVAASMAWASARDIRIVVKGTGHDMNGRSSGAYSMSVWTHNFKRLEFNSAWALPDGNGTTDVVIAGSGNNWGLVYTAADKVGKSVVGGGASSVGLGGYIQGGGHGPLSSTYGLAADQVLQATIVTTEGQILVANAQNNTDLFWAIRGGGGGQYGVVTEYVLKTHPAPSSVVTGSLSLSINGTDNSSTTAAWNAYTILIMSLPDLMDAGLAGAAFTKTEAGLVGLSHSQGFYGYNISSSDMTTMVEPVLAKMRAQGSNTTLSVTWEEPVTYPNFTSFFQAQNPTSEGAGGGAVMSSRLLGRAQLTDNVTQEEVTSNLQKAFITQESNGGGYIIIGLQGGPGPAKVPENMRGALNPVWRTSYLHTIAMGATVNTTADPKTTLTAAADWLDENLEAVWREWAPDTGSYMNEANPYNTEFKHDYYGTSYDRLLEIKKKYDPTESLYVLTGVGSDGWDYDLSSGKLCRTT